MIRGLILKIKRKETPVYAFLYRIGKSITSINIPDFLLPIYRILYTEREIRINLLRRLATFFYYAPLFRSRCSSIGDGFTYVKLQQGFPYISGNISIIFGSNVTFHSRSTITASKVLDNPSLFVGDNTFLGPGLSIAVADRIDIGSQCHISSSVSIADNDGHPIDAESRIRHDPVSRENIKPVFIGNRVWVGEGVRIMKGVTIGDNSIIGSKSVVVKDVPPDCIVSGNPAKIIRNINSIENSN